MEGALKQLLTGVSHNVAQLLVDEEPATIESDICNPNRSLFKGSTETAFTGLEFVFKPLPFSDISTHANPLTKISVLLEERDTTNRECAIDAIVAPKTILGLVGPFVGKGI